jgi:hypothetical protein
VCVHYVSIVVRMCALVTLQGTSGKSTGLLRLCINRKNREAAQVKHEILFCY